MAADETIKVKIELDDDLTGDLKKARTTTKTEADKMKGSFDGLKSSVKGLVGAYLGLQGIKIIGRFFATAAKTAGDLSEALSKQSTVFRGLEKEVKAMNKELVESYSLSRLEAAKFLSTIQDTLVPLGIARARAADMSFEVVKLSRDLASFNNIPTDQVVRDIQSALVGNVETLRKYGVALNESIIKQKAMSMGLIKTTKEAISPTNKALAVLQLTIEGSGDAVGDWNRTSNSFNNQLVTLKSSWEDFNAAMGKSITESPLVLGWLNGANIALKKMTDLLVGSKKEDTVIKEWRENIVWIKEDIKDLNKKLASEEAFKNTVYFSQEAVDKITEDIQAKQSLVVFWEERIKATQKQAEETTPKPPKPPKPPGGGDIADPMDDLFAQLDMEAKFKQDAIDKDIERQTEANEKYKEALKEKFDADMDYLKKREAAEEAAAIRQQQINAMAAKTAIMGAFDLAEQIAGMNRDSSKEAFRTWQKTAIAQSMVAGALGVSKALGGSPPPLNFVNAALVAAAAGVQVAKIQNQKPPEFATGGDFVTNGRQNIVVGDNPGGRERVQVTPLSSPNINGPQSPSISVGGDTIIINGNADDAAIAAIGATREQQLADFRDMIIELGASGNIPVLS